MDCEAFIAGIDPEAYDWAHVHLASLLMQQSRHSDGHVFSKGESVYPFDEQLAAASAAEMSARLDGAQSR